MAKAKAAPTALPHDLDGVADRLAEQLAAAVFTKLEAQLQQRLSRLLTTGVVALLARGTPPATPRSPPPVRGARPAPEPTSGRLRALLSWPIGDPPVSVLDLLRQAWDAGGTSGGETASRLLAAIGIRPIDACLEGGNPNCRCSACVNVWCRRIPRGAAGAGIWLSPQMLRSRSIPATGVNFEAEFAAIGVRRGGNVRIGSVASRAIWLSREVIESG
jgi:hypothetical protein